MYTDTLIIGQGVCGTWLSYWLQKSGADFMVIDNHLPDSASRVASGIINPVTGRRMAKTWLADDLMPFAWRSYSDFSQTLGVNLITELKLVDFFNAPDRRLSFEKRSQEFESYLNWPIDENEWRPFFDYPFGFGIVTPVYQVQIQAMLEGWRQMLIGGGRLIAETYDAQCLSITDFGVRYKDITANRILFCDGTAVMEQPFFNLLPFAFNKGEALIIDVPELPTGYLFKSSQTITAWQNGLFWVGSNYDRQYEHNQPTETFYKQTTAWLKLFLKLPFTVHNHIASIRPTTVERRPFAGFHPKFPAVGILNGMGTKGVSLSPYLASQLCGQILHQTPVINEANISQYARVLSRG